MISATWLSRYTTGDVDMFIPIEREDDLGKLATAYRHSRVMSRPVVVGFTRELLKGDAP